MNRTKKFVKAITPNKLIKFRSRVLHRKRLNHQHAAKLAELDQMKSLLSTSQAGQDYWVYGEVFNEMTNGFFLDVGAHDGIRFSNTFLLEMRYGWKGICIEGNPDTFQNLIKHRQAICVNTCVDQQEGQVLFAKRGVLGGIVAGDCDNKDKQDGEPQITVRTRPLADVLREHNAPNRIDYLTIDIEGAEDRALLSFPFDEFVFTCITIERPSELIRGLFNRNDYVLIKELPGFDCFFVHRSFLNQHHENLIAFHEKSFHLLPLEK